MPADPITPSRAAAWVDTAPSNGSVWSRVSAIVRAPSALASFSPISGTIDGVSLQGTYATTESRLVLVTAQPSPAGNGLYRAGGGSLVSLGVSYNGSGVATKTGLTANRLYYVAFVSSTSVSNGSQTYQESCFIAADISGTLTFYGTPSSACTDYLYEASLTRSASFDQPNEWPTYLTVHVTGGTESPTWWACTSTVTTVGSSAISFTQVGTGQVPGANFTGGTNWSDTSSTAASVPTGRDASQMTNTGATARTLSYP